jgi:hypothetical protein
VTDTIGAGRERFGESRLRACLADPDPHRMIERVRTATDEFRVGPRVDDSTAIAIHRLHPSDIDRAEHTDGDTDGDTDGEVDGSPERGTVLP